MAVSHQQSDVLPDGTPWYRRLGTEVWASIAIGAIWLAVALTAMFGPDLVFTSSGGSDTGRIPSGVIVALFAWLATRAIARSLQKS
jgi:hypothetical protein